MSKNLTSWFTHDADATDDPKIMLLIDQLGPEGYGIFWIIVEILRKQPEYKYPMKLLPIIAKRYGASAEKFKTVVTKYQLFEVDEEENFFSLSLLKRMDKLEEYREQKRLAGLKSAAKRKQLQQKSNTVATPLQHRSNDVQLVEDSIVKDSIEENSKEKNSKEEEGKEKKADKSARSRFTVPLFDDVLSFFIEKSYQHEAENYYNYYQSNGWMVGRNKMKDWKSAAANWIKRSQTQFKPAPAPRSGNGKKTFTEAAKEWISG